MMDELIGVARKLGIEVRTQPIRIPSRSFGGLCRLRGRQVLLLDQRSSVADRVGTIAEALSQFERELDGVFLTPEARRVVETARAKLEFAFSRELKNAAGAPRTDNVQVLARPKPGMRKARR
jgi:hypothetical protein